MNRDPSELKSPPKGLQHYLRHRRYYAAALFISVSVVGGIFQLVTQYIDVRRWNLPFQIWELSVWQVSSRVVILLLIPAILWFDRYATLTWRNWRRTLPLHIAASLVFSVVHVGSMFLLRDLAYQSIANRDYHFDSWIGQLFYEYLKDVATYFNLLFLIYAYRFILLRLQGEASEISAAETESSQPQTSPQGLPARFLVRKLNKEFLISAEDVEWLEAQGNYVNLHVRDRAYPLRSTMTAIQSRLDPLIFVRVHRSYIVNVNFLAEIQPLDSGDARLTLQNGTQIPCSRTYKSSLKERINNLDTDRKIMLSQAN